MGLGKFGDMSIKFPLVYLALWHLIKPTIRGPFGAFIIHDYKNYSKITLGHSKIWGNIPLFRQHLSIFRFKERPLPQSTFLWGVIIPTLPLSLLINTVIISRSIIAAINIMLERLMKMESGGMRNVHALLLYFKSNYLQINKQLEI